MAVSSNIVAQCHILVFGTLHIDSVSSHFYKTSTADYCDVHSFYRFEMFAMLLQFRLHSSYLSNFGYIFARGTCSAEFTNTWHSNKLFFNAPLMSCSICGRQKYPGDRFKSRRSCFAWIRWDMFDKNEFDTVPRPRLGREVHRFSIKNASTSRLRIALQQIMPLCFCHSIFWHPLFNVHYLIEVSAGSDSRLIEHVIWARAKAGMYLSAKECQNCRHVYKSHMKMLL